MTKKFRHIILTFFNIPKFNEDPFLKDNPLIRKILSQEWLEMRLKLFEEITLPSIIKQTNQKFWWFIMFHPDTQKEFKDKFQKILPKNASCIYDLNWQENIFKKLYRATEDYFLFTRIDSDDAFHKKAIKNIQNSFKKISKKQNEDFIINFKAGYKLFLKNQQLYQFYPPYPAHFCTKCSKLRATRDINTGWNHINIKKKFDYFEIKNKRPYYIETIHNTNLRNSLDAGDIIEKFSREKSKKILKRKFGIKLTLENIKDIYFKNEIMDLQQSSYQKNYEENNKPPRIEIIQRLINKIKAKNYLEIGVKNCNTFNKIKCRNKIAVNPIINNRKKDFFSRYYEATSNKFFENYEKLLGKNKLEVVFIDGLHTFEQSLKDVLNSLNHLDNKGIIIMHDCNPQSKAAACPNQKEAKKIEGFNGNWNGDVWKTIVYLRENKKDLNVFVIDQDQGIGIISKKTENEKKIKELKIKPGDLNKLTYLELEKNRKDFLNLKNKEYLEEFIKKL
ncbi:hypothetical protein FJZ17_03295 [Candidatus Pacearchaeota archaeon]|nr:hypothetical protein [Candidatus Pacearchaeota archaeon]